MQPGLQYQAEPPQTPQLREPDVPPLLFCIEVPTPAGGSGVGEGATPRG